MMNKQEVDSLIANNSVRQTNRDWLESLSDEEFSMCIARLACSMTNCSGCDYFENGCKDTMAQECTEFLRAEHKESDNG